MDSESERRKSTGSTTGPVSEPTTISGGAPSDELPRRRKQRRQPKQNSGGANGSDNPNSPDEEVRRNSRYSGGKSGVNITKKENKRKNSGEHDGSAAMGASPQLPQAKGGYHSHQSGNPMGGSPQLEQTRGTHPSQPPGGVSTPIQQSQTFPHYVNRAQFMFTQPTFSSSQGQSTFALSHSQGHYTPIHQQQHMQHVRFQPSHTMGSPMSVMGAYGSPMVTSPSLSQPGLSHMNSNWCDSNLTPSSYGMNCNQRDGINALAAPVNTCSKDIEVLKQQETKAVAPVKMMKENNCSHGSGIKEMDEHKDTNLKTPEQTCLRYRKDQTPISLSNKFSVLSPSDSATTNTMPTTTVVTTTAITTAFAAVSGYTDFRTTTIMSTSSDCSEQKRKKPSEATESSDPKRRNVETEDGQDWHELTSEEVMHKVLTEVMSLKSTVNSMNSNVERISEESKNWKMEVSTMRTEVSDIKDSLEMVHNLVNDETKLRKENYDNLKKLIDERAKESSQTLTLTKNNATQLKTTRDSVTGLQTRMDKLEQEQKEVNKPINEVKSFVETALGPSEFPVNKTVVGQHVWYKEGEDLDKLHQ